MMAHKTSLPLALLFLLAVALLVGGAARADGPPSPEAVKAAKAHFLQGKAFQDVGAYDQAIAEYQAAYKLAPLPDLIFNLAQCARLKGDKRQALTEYQRYLATAPDGRGAPDARKQIALLTKEIAESDAQAAAAAAAERKPAATQPSAPVAAAGKPEERGAPVVPAPANNPRPDAAAGAAASAATSAGATGPEATGGGAPAATSNPPPAPSPEAPPAPSGSSDDRRLRIAGLITAGVGGALLVGGIVFGIKASSASDDLANLKAGATWNQGLYDSGKADQRNMYILVGAGSAVVIGGAVTYLLGRRAAHETTATVAAAPLSGGGALALSARF